MREQGAGRSQGGRDSRQHPARVALHEDKRPDPQIAADPRRGRILAGVEGGGLRSVLIALASTVVFIGLVVLAIVHSAGWPAVRRAFFDSHIFWTSFPEISRAFLVNVKIFLIAEALILVAALGIAILRGLPGPVLFPIRALAVFYTDLFRGIPTILVIYILGFGAPALELTGIPRSPMFWGVVALVLVYS